MTEFGGVVAVSRDESHRFSKTVVDRIQLLAGLGVEGDAHAGVTVQHRSRVAADPTQPNLRQVHLIAVELLAELGEQGFAVGPGDLGENILTRGIDLLGLPTDTNLRIGPAAVVRITGLRNPCAQINGFAPHLLHAVLGRGADGALIRRAGVMGVVVVGGLIAAGDGIDIVRPEKPHRPLERV